MAFQLVKSIHNLIITTQILLQIHLGIDSVAIEMHNFQGCEQVRIGC